MRAVNIIEFALTFRDEVAAGKLKDASRLYPNRLEVTIERLRKLAVELERLNLNACNYGLSDRQESRRVNVINDLRSECRSYGVEAVIQGDPRGAAFGLFCEKTRRYNSMGGLEAGFRLIFEGK